MTAIPFSTPTHGTIRICTIEAVEADGVVRLERGERARLAIPHGYEPRCADRVVVVEAQDGALYVVGVAQALRAVLVPSASPSPVSPSPVSPSPVSPQAVRSESGAQARLEHLDGEPERLRVYDAHGTLLFEHLPHEGRSVVHSRGDLLFATDGDLRFEAAGSVQVLAADALELASRAEVSVRACDLEGETRSQLRLRETGTFLHTAHFGGAAERADLQAREINLVAQSVRTVAQRVRTKAADLELEVERLVERTETAWRKTEGLSQTTAGRLRLIAHETFAALGRRTLVRADEDVKIKGDKIYLA